MTDTHTHADGQLTRPLPSPLAAAPAFLPLIFCAVFLTLRVSLGIHLPPSAAGASLVVAGWSLIGTHTPSSGSLRVIAAVVILCAALAVRLDICTRVVEQPVGSVAGEVLVESTRDFGSRHVLLARVRSLSSGIGEAGSLVVLEFRYAMPKARPGDIMLFDGQYAPFRRSDAGFDELAYWRPKGAVAKVECREATVVGYAVSIARIRHSLTERIRRSLPPRTAGYMSAITTGERDPRLTSMHRAVGTAHLLAVSGFHIGLIFLLCSMVFGQSPFGLAATSAAVWLFAALTGASPSAVRAAAMIQIVIVGKLFGRGGSTFNTAAAAGCIMLAYDPWLFWDAGWRLSMLAVLSASAAGQIKARMYVKTIVSGTLVWLATSVESARIFGAAPIAGLVVNLVALPVFSLLFPIAIIFSVPELVVGYRANVSPSAIPELLFAVWERFSAGTLSLMPDEVGFSTVLVAAAASAMAFFFARASGAAAARAIIMSILAALCAAVSRVIV